MGLLSANKTYVHRKLNHAHKGRLGLGEQDDAGRSTSAHRKQPPAHQANLKLQQRGRVLLIQSPPVTTMASGTTQEGRDACGWARQTKRHLVSVAAVQGVLGLEQGANACSSPKKVFVQNCIANELAPTSRPRSLTLSLQTNLSTLQMPPSPSLPPSPLTGPSARSSLVRF